MVKRNSSSDNFSGGKRYKTEHTVKNLTHYPFSTDSECNRMFPWVIPRADFFGRSKIMEVLEYEVCKPMYEPESFEVLSTRDQGFPLNRCLRFFGVSNSSKRTAVLAFAQSNKIDVLEIDGDISLKPRKDLRFLLNKAQSLCKPTLIVLRRFSTVFSNVPYVESSPQNVKFRSKATHYMERMLERLVRTKTRAWVVVLSDSKPPSPYELDKYFVGSTYWVCAELDSGLYDFYTDADRAMILTSLIKRYNNDNFPIPRELLLAFCFKYGKYCTFRQLQTFVASVFNELRRQSSEFSADTLDNFAKEHNLNSLSIYDAHAMNILNFM